VSSWVRSIAMAVIFLVLGAFSASLCLEVRHETPAVAVPPPGLWEGRRIRVEVLNAAGVDRLAKRATDRLRELEFDVVHYGNAEEMRDTTVVIARLDQVEPARRVADVLGLRQVIHRPDRNLYLDVTVVLGNDWAGPGELARAEGEGPLQRWWARVKRAAGRLWPG
jgi:hypothetical protein